MLIEFQRDPLDRRSTYALWRSPDHPRECIALDMPDYHGNFIRVTNIDNSKPPGDRDRVRSYSVSFDELKAKLFPPASPPVAGSLEGRMC